MYIESIKGQEIDITFENGEDQLFLGDVLKIVGTGKNGVLAQIKKIKTSEYNPNFNVAVTEPIFTVTSEGKIYPWKGNAPSPDLFVSKISDREMLSIIKSDKVENPIYFGDLSLYPCIKLKVDLSFLEFPTVIVSDKKTIRQKSIELLAKEISSNEVKTLILDFNGDYFVEDAFALKAGRDLKLPFDQIGLESLYNIGLKGTPAESKAIIEDIFSEVEDYLSSGEVEYLPFSDFKDAVEVEYESRKNPNLVLLKNRLKKLSKLGLFADAQYEIYSILNVFKNGNLVKLDLSAVPDEWKHAFVDFVSYFSYKMHQPLVVLADYSESGLSLNYNKSYRLFKKAGICSLVAMSHKSEFINSAMELCDNFIVFSPETNSRFISLTPFINRLRGAEAVVSGYITNYVPVFTDLSSAFGEKASTVEISVAVPEVYNSPNSFKPSENEPKSLEDVYTIESFEEESIDETGERDSVEIALEDISEGDETTDVAFYDTLDEQEDSVQDIEEQEEDIDYTPDNVAIDYDDESQSLQVDEQDDEYQQDSDEEESYDEIEEEDIAEEDYEFYNQASDSVENAEESEDSEFDEVAYSTQGEFTQQDLDNFVDGEEQEETSEDYEETEEIEEEFDYSDSEEFEDESLLDYVDSENTEVVEEENEYTESEYEDDEEEGEFSQEDIESFMNSYDNSDLESDSAEDTAEEEYEFYTQASDSVENAEESEESEFDEVAYSTQGEFTQQDLDNFVDEEEQEEISEEYEETEEEDFDYSDSEEFEDESLLDYVDSENTQVVEEENEYTESEYEDDEEDNQQSPVPVVTPQVSPEIDVPVYNVPKSKKGESSVEFKEGDVVEHQKYGIGVIKKIIGYSEKKLCSIQFENVGRRLLDPNLADLRKVQK